MYYQLYKRNHKYFNKYNQNISKKIKKILFINKTKFNKNFLYYSNYFYFIFIFVLHQIFDKLSSYKHYE